ncbi:MAG: D-2-hydroxyacid dehydrogenase [Anaerolineae bacterium]|nr:MAG: D-2-hydroxyacid dehydrogenase [Anaerolineae bacterium]
MTSMADIPVLITVDMPEALLDRLRAVSPHIQIDLQPTSEASDFTEEQLGEMEVLYTRQALPEPEQVPNLRWIQFHWSGIDDFVDQSLLRSDVIVTTLSGAAVPQMGEFAMTMMMALGHHLPAMMEDQGKKIWADNRFTRFRPVELRGSTVGIVGYGNIGREIARLCQSFGAQVLATKRDLRVLEMGGYALEGLGDAQADIPERIYPPQALPSMASECDFLILTVPLTPETRGLVNAKVFKSMKSTAYLIDISRGGVVDQGALVEALKEGEIAGAGLDVYPVEPLPVSSPLWELPNVILSPHVAGTSGQYLARAADLFAENLRRYIANEPLLNRYDPRRGY